MRQQRNIFQTKEQDKISELSEVEIGNLPEKELRVMIIKMIQELWKRMDAEGEVARNSQQRENTRNKQS